MPTIAPNMTIEEIARNWPQCKKVLAHYHLDLCCGGMHSLQFAAEKHGLDLSLIVRALNVTIQDVHSASIEHQTTAVPSLIQIHSEKGESHRDKQDESPTLTRSTTIAEVLERYPQAREIFDRHGLHGCGGESGPAESLEFFARVHQVDLAALLRDLRSEVKAPPPEEYVYEETLGDTIYRRFFKAGIAIVLTVGGLWGALNLLQLAFAKNFLDLRLVPAIHAHAHAMIFGWVGLFVMGFAYQSFPRFKHTQLWRPALANFSFYLMLGGILMRAVAELTQPDVLGLALGALSTVAEIVAISLFITIIFKTARRSIQPHNTYEKFIFASLVWFFVQAVLSDLFFFAKATAVGQQQLIHRIALIDGPLRDIQLLGFATLIIAGVSQRFVPLVYDLMRPKNDRQTLIFWLINGSLLLDVLTYALMVSTRNPIFAVGLEISYILMLLWAIMLTRQLGIFSKPQHTDRSWKFIRAAYIWLLVSMIMLPFFMLYGVLTHQYFAHSYMGAYRHAFTVGFVSLMIMGVAARVVPILAGVDSAAISSLWGPFVLINFGAAGRVVLQILTDFAPHIAYSLVGLTGFMEVAALAWWGIELWHTMNLAKIHRSKLLQGPVPLPAA